VDAIADGADVSLLLSKQDQLKVEQVAFAHRLEELSAEIAPLPDAEYRFDQK
jgi:hypothetical protein